MSWNPSTRCATCAALAVVGAAVAIAPPVAAQPITVDAAAYAAGRQGRTSFETPEVFELANIILSLSPAGRDRNSTFQNTAYYTAVMQHFGPFADHPVVSAVRYNVRRNDIQQYYNFRDNSFRYCFIDDERIRLCTPHPASFPLPDSASGVWERDIALVEDFARRTGFRRFYAEHTPQYDALADQYRAEVDLATMRAWLERNFSARWDSFRILFSPLIAASHSAHRYEPDGFREAVMLTASPPFVDGYVTDPALRRPELARMLFTELDHLYVNPATDVTEEAVDTAFADVAFWSSEEAARYSNAYLVFNEYMTWAVFLLWAEDNYPTETFEPTIDWIVQSMTGYRGFPKFPDFFAALRQIRARAPAGTRVEDLYPALLDWATTYRARARRGPAG